MNISYDKFVRTTDEIHEHEVQKIFKKMYDKGDIYLGEYSGLYCVPCESFWTESQLVDGKCPDCGREVSKRSEEAYFFKLSNYQDRLEKLFENGSDFLEPAARKNEMLNNFIKPGLQDLCVSRTSFKWGIPVPFNDKHVIYVWLDALTNYITFLGYDTEKPSEEFKKYWPADLHLIGKDIVRFHSIYWPAFLWSLDLELPHKIFGHPWLLSNNDKIGKSRGNAIYADDLADKYGVDAVRYYVLHETPFANDGNITTELLEERFNSDLANILGNLVNRTLAMSKKYFNSVVENPKVYDSVDETIVQYAKEVKSLVDEKMDNYRISDALEDIFELLRRSNKYIDDTTPWVLAKDESKSDRLKTVIYNLLESIRIASILLQAFMPDTSEKIFKMLNTKNTSFDTIDFGNLEEGITLNEAEVLFARIQKNN